MLLLTTTSDVIRIVTDAAATVDVHASWADNASGTISVGSTNTAITTATTTTVVGSPGASTARTVNRLNIRNKSAATTVTVTVQLYNGAVFELDSRVLGPGATIVFDEKFGFYPTPTGTLPTRPWYGKLAGCYGDGDPGELMVEVQRAGWIGPQATQIGATIARCSAFMLPFDLTFNRLRVYGIATLASTFTIAIYRMSDLARLTASITFSTVAATWASIGSALNITLSKDVMYFVAVSANAATATQGPAAFGGTTTATTGQINTAPTALPGNMVLGGATAVLDHFQFQFTVTGGAMPATAATLAAPGAWTGGMPAVWLDALDT